MTTTLTRPTVFDYDPGEFWDEMFVSPDEVRPYYASLASALSTLSHAEVERRQRAADLSFQARGISFDFPPRSGAKSNVASISVCVR